MVIVTSNWHHLHPYTSFQVQWLVVAMPTFETIPLEIREHVYHHLLWPYQHVGSGQAIYPTPLVHGLSKHRARPYESLHPAILGVSRKINAEAIETLYGVNRFMFIMGPEVDDLKKWFEKVGTKNLQRIRKAGIILVSVDHPVRTYPEIHEMNRTFSKCLKMFVNGCPKVQDLSILECWTTGRVRMAASAHVLALTKVGPLKQLTLQNWVSLDAADQMTRLMGFRGCSHLHFEMKPLTHPMDIRDGNNKPVWTVTVKAIEEKDEAVKAKVARAWKKFDEALEKELDL